MSRGGTLRQRCAAALIVLGSAHSGSLARAQEEPQVGPAGAQSREEITASEGLAEDETSRAIADLTRRAQQLGQHEGLGPEVQGPLSGVKRALEAMRQAWSRGDLRVAQRAEGLARAGLALAERRYSLSLEQALMRAAVARRDAARARVHTAAAAREVERERLEALVPMTSPEAKGSTP